jgi:hypothetical protein
MMIFLERRIFRNLECHRFSDRGCFGRKRETRIPTTAIPSRMKYTIFPPASFFCSESENKEEANDGAIDLIDDAIACAIPFTAPRDALLGAPLTMII